MVLTLNVLIFLVSETSFKLLLLWCFILRYYGMKTKIEILCALGLLFFCMISNANANAGEMVDTRITEITVYPNDVVHVMKEGDACCGSEFYTIIEGGIVPGSVRVIGEQARVESISITAYIKNETKETKETKIKRPLTIGDMVNQSMGKKIEAVTSYGDVSGTLYMLEGDLMFLSDARWIRSNETLEMPFFTMKVSDIRNMVFREKPDFQQVYKTVFEVPGVRIPAPPVSSYDPYTYYTGSVTGRDSKLSWRYGGEGRRDVDIVYRASGVSWEPVYHLDIDEDKTAGFGFWVKITNNMGIDLENVNVKVVAGNIKMEGVYRSMEYMSATQVAFGNVAFGSAIGAAVSALEEYEVYDLGEISLNAGETKIVRVFGKNVEFERDYVWDARLDDVNWRYVSEMKNGNVTVSVYRDMMLIGMDTISWTPNGREAKVTVGYAPDIEVRKRVTVKEIPGDQYGYYHKGTLKMINYKNEEVKLTVMDTLPGDAEGFKSNINYDEKPGNLLYWNITLNPGEEKDLTYTYMTD
ncbi:MAG: hypothetical protein A7315_06085 [Candidatus Altiarchaeales archaeon WOR_SM1_79]|nr:MAG: hypothetical protein A7315_06085 [Candidatus Altiarchaeales archaeon WOR_SM1_79]